VFFIIRLSRRDRVLYYSRIMDEVEEERWIYKTRRELKTTGLPSFPKKKRPSLFVFFVVFCQKMKKNVVKNPSKNSYTRRVLKKHAHQIGDGDDDERTKERGSSSRPWSSRLLFFFFCFFFPSARGKREISRGASRISTSTTDAAGN